MGEDLAPYPSFDLYIIKHAEYICGLPRKAESDDMRNILEYLEETCRRVPDKDAFICEGDRISFSELRRRAFEYGMKLAERAGGVRNRPICVIGEREIDALVCMLGCVYSGNYYVLVDASLPDGRIEAMLESVDFLGAVSCSGKAYHVPGLVFSDVYGAGTEEGGSEETGTCRHYSSAETEEIIGGIIENSCSFDPLYGVFTSGTTGVPKLVVKSHASMISFIEDFTEMFGIDENEVLGNQFPFYFDASTKDLYCCLKCGLTVHIIPKQFFSFPQLLLNYLIENRITTIIWVPSALSLVANGDGLETIGVPQTVSKVFFVGEQMPVRQLNYWKRHMPDTRFINIYGSTEVAGNFLYYIYEDMLPDDQRLPTGVPFPNTKVFLLAEDGELITESGIEGEICVVGDTLSLGYYGNREMTDKVFVQNPLVGYRETMYRTGDMASYDENGNIVWASRKDFQIKHMGYRIELSEIEITLGAIPGIEECCCSYDPDKKKILFYYTAASDMKKEIGKQVRAKLPKYMFPSKYIRLDSMPHNANGKIDRKKLAQPGQ